MCYSLCVCVCRALSRRFFFSDARVVLSDSVFRRMHARRVSKPARTLRVYFFFIESFVNFVICLLLFFLPKKDFGSTFKKQKKKERRRGHRREGCPKREVKKKEIRETKIISQNSFIQKTLRRRESWSIETLPVKKRANVEKTPSARGVREVSTEIRPSNRP